MTQDDHVYVRLDGSSSCCQRRDVCACRVSCRMAMCECLLSVRARDHFM